MRLRIPRSKIGRIVASLAIGVGTPVLLIGVLLLRSHGNEPQGLCARIQTKDSAAWNGVTLPIDMSRGGDVPYICGLHWDYLALKIALPALGFALLAYALMALLRRSQQ